MTPFILMSDVPLASYEDPRWIPAGNNMKVGNRGATGNPATLQTNTSVANTDLVISAKDCAYGTDPPLRIQYAVLAPGEPLSLYEDGYPAILTPPTDLGFMIIMKRAGAWGNHITLTLVNPGRPASLRIGRPTLNDVVINLAYASGAVTTTPALLIAAINSDPELSSYMTAFASSATVSILPAMATKSFLGGADVPGLELVALASSTASASTSTGANVAALLNGSRYVTAKPAGASTGLGVVPAVTAMWLTGPGAVASATQTLNMPNRGEISDQYLARRSAWAHRRRAGDPLGKENNKTLQVRDSRFGAMRTYQRVPKQDRAVTTSRVQNHQSDWLAHATLG